MLKQNKNKLQTNCIFLTKIIRPAIELDNHSLGLDMCIGLFIKWR